MFSLYYSAVCRETNLKFRQALTVTHAELNGESAKQNLGSFDGLYGLFGQTLEPFIRSDQKISFRSPSFIPQVLCGVRNQMVIYILSKVSCIGKESATFWTQTTCSSEELYCVTQTQPMDWLYTQVSQICAVKVNAG